MSELINQLEAVLFAAAEPLSPKQLAKATSQPEAAVRKALIELVRQLASRGLRLLEANGEYSLATAPETAEAIQRYLGQQTRTELSRPALETLAIIAYKQPVTKSDIEAIRGVGSDQTVKNLLLRGLIVETGRSTAPGQPRQYATSTRFLQHLGISKASDLPTIDPSGEKNHEA